MLQVGDWVFDSSTRRLCGRGGERRLSPKAAGVLLALAETPGRVWSRDALLERVWPNVIVGEEVLTHAVAELRRALGDDSRDPRLIETIHKSGYRLLCESASDGRHVAAIDVALEADAFDLESYAAYLEASTLFDRGGLRLWERALELFRCSIEHDPGFAPAWSGAAKTLLFLDQYCAPRPGALELALEHCAAARRLAPHLGEPVAVEALAHAMYGNDSRSRQLFGVAVRLAPSSNEVHHLLGRACFAHLDARLAPSVLERAAALRSDDFVSAQLAATSCELNGDFERARINFALTLGRVDAWLDIFPGDYKALSGRAHCLVQLNRDEEACTALGTVCGHAEPVRHSPACVLSLAGELGRALDVLEESVEEGWRYSAWLRRDPCLNRLRTTPRFQRIARSIDA
jgi:DNA-binding winged helix-turn-helix (wHTH) protein